MLLTESTYTTIAHNIKTRRSQLHLSQAQLAERSDVSLDTIKSVESGRRSMNLDTYLRIVNALGTTPAALLEAEPLQGYTERLAFLFGGRSENELRFVLHVVEQALKAEERYIKVR